MLFLLKIKLIVVKNPNIAAVKELNSGLLRDITQQVSMEGFDSGIFEFQINILTIHLFGLVQ